MTILTGHVRDLTGQIGSTWSNISIWGLSELNREVKKLLYIFLRRHEKATVSSAGNAISFNNPLHVNEGA